MRMVVPTIFLTAMMALAATVSTGTARTAGGVPCYEDVVTVPVAKGACMPRSSADLKYWATDAIRAYFTTKDPDIGITASGPLMCSNEFTPFVLNCRRLVAWTHNHAPAAPHTGTCMARADVIYTRGHVIVRNRERRRVWHAKALPANLYTPGGSLNGVCQSWMDHNSLGIPLEPLVP